MGKHPLFIQLESDCADIKKDIDLSARRFWASKKEFEIPGLPETVVLQEAKLLVKDFEKYIGKLKELIQKADATSEEIQIILREKAGLAPDSKVMMNIFTINTDYDYRDELGF